MVRAGRSNVAVLHVCMFSLTRCIHFKDPSPEFALDPG